MIYKTVMAKDVGIGDKLKDVSGWQGKRFQVDYKRYLDGGLVQLFGVIEAKSGRPMVQGILYDNETSINIIQWQKENHSKKVCKIHFWAKTAFDGRWCASSGGTIECEQKHAYKIAKEINQRGQAAIDEAATKRQIIDLRMDQLAVSAASGHGCSVHYPSGQIRYIKRD